MGKKIMIRIRDEQPGSYFRELVNTLDFWVKILKFYDADTGWKKFGSGFRYKHPGSASLVFLFSPFVLIVLNPFILAADLDL
jgi:hypothetical protein